MDKKVIQGRLSYVVMIALMCLSLYLLYTSPVDKQTSAIIGTFFTVMFMFIIVEYGLVEKRELSRLNERLLQRISQISNTDAFYHVVFTGIPEGHTVKVQIGGNIKPQRIVGYHAPVKLPVGLEIEFTLIDHRGVTVAYTRAISHAGLNLVEVEWLISGELTLVVT